MRQNRRQGTGHGVVVGLLALTLVGVGVGVTRASHNFPDVPDSAFYHDFVQFLVDNGITTGCGGGNYCGDDAVTRGQMAVFLKRLSDLTDTRLAALAQQTGVDLAALAQQVEESLGALQGCPPDAVKVGPTCMDKYEASVWQTTDAAIIEQIRAGTVTLAQLQAAGAVQRGVGADDYGAACPDTGHGCLNLYAVSIPGVFPSESMTWFQAVAIARNSGRRLPTNQEWQAAAFGTPDGPPCIVSAAGPGLTGTGGCVSDVGAFDLVGNVYEWVAEWVPQSTGLSPGWNLFAVDDEMGILGASTFGGPGALRRGGSFFDAAAAGPLAVTGRQTPQTSGLAFGFRAAR